MTNLSHLLQAKIEDRLHAVNLIWDSILEESQNLSISQEEKKLLDKRLIDYSQNPRSLSSWEDFIKELGE